MSCEVKSGYNLSLQHLNWNVFLQWISSLVWIRREMHKLSTVYKWKESKTVENKYFGGFWWDVMHEADYALWIIDLYFVQKEQFKVKDGFFFKQLLSSKEWCGLCDVFISCLDSHSDGTHSLQSIRWYKATCLRICSDEETNSSTSWMAWGWVHFHWVNYSFKSSIFVLGVFMI